MNTTALVHGQVHAATGAKHLFVNPGFTTHVKGLTCMESQSLLRHLFEAALKPDYQVSPLAANLSGESSSGLKRMRCVRYDPLFLGEQKKTTARCG